METSYDRNLGRESGRITMVIKKASPQINKNQPLDTFYSTASNDRKVILKHLVEYVRLTTLQAREELGVMSPAPRILELRRMGYNIITYRQYKRDITGRNHYQAEYVLMVGGAS